MVEFKSILAQSIIDQNLKLELPKFYSLVDVNNNMQFVSKVFADQTLKIVDLVC